MSFASATENSTVFSTTTSDLFDFVSAATVAACSSSNDPEALKILSGILAAAAAAAEAASFENAINKDTSDASLLVNDFEFAEQSPLGFTPLDSPNTPHTKPVTASPIYNPHSAFHSPLEETLSVVSPSEAASPWFDNLGDCFDSPDLDIFDAPICDFSVTNLESQPLFASLDEIQQLPKVSPSTVDHAASPAAPPLAPILGDFTSLISKLVTPVPLEQAVQPPIRDAGRRKPSKVYPCPVPNCPKSFTRRFNLETHIRTHDPHRARPFPCPNCTKTFVRIHDLERHETVHSKAKTHECPDPSCGKRFTRRDALRRHMKTAGCTEP
ncbi:hypothetical protein HK104_010551 [Borealophlyctis nickersoniae]|nr:hypothetical protein HK104_010551 [Borealophlyctis nickersoniae]